jgi:hypothetical protein
MPCCGAGRVMNTLEPGTVTSLAEIINDAGISLNVVGVKPGATSVGGATDLRVYQSVNPFCLTFTLLPTLYHTLFVNHAKHYYASIRPDSSPEPTLASSGLRIPLSGPPTSLFANNEGPFIMLLND